MSPAIQTTSQPATISAFIPAGDTAQWAKTLKHMAALVKSANKKNYCLPVLGCAHLAPHPDGIAVSVTDLKIGHTAVLPGILDAPICVEMPALLALFTGTTEDVYLDARRGRATGQAGNATTILTTIDADEFPIFHMSQQPEGAPAYQLSSGALQAALATVVPAVSTDTTRGVLTGVSIQTVDNWLTLIGTDAWRMHVVAACNAGTTVVDGEFTKNDTAPILVPGATAAYMARTLPDGKTLHNASLYLTPHQNGNSAHVNLTIVVDNQTWLVTLLSDQYVNYRQILPKSIPAWVRFDAKALAAAVKALLPKDSAMYSVDLLADGDTILVSSTVGQRTVPGITFGNFDGIFRLNGKFLLDALVPVGKGEAIINVNTATHACTVTNGSQDDGYTAVIMPQDQKPR